MMQPISELPRTQRGKISRDRCPRFLVLSLSTSTEHTYLLKAWSSHTIPPHVRTTILVRKQLGRAWRVCKDWHVLTDFPCSSTGIHHHSDHCVPSFSAKAQEHPFAIRGMTKISILREGWIASYWKASC